MNYPKVELIRTQIHLTNRCNLKCKYCEVPQVFAHSRDLPDRKWIKIVKELCELETKEITISGGGEPTLRFNLLLRILKITRDNRIKTGIITNGTQVTKEFAKKIVEVQPDEWRTSICSPDRKVDAFLRGKNLSNKSFRGISYIAEWKKKLKSDLPKLEVWMLQTKYNIVHIFSMIEKASSIGANSVSLRMVNPPNSWLYPTEEQRKKLIKNLKSYKKLCKELGIELKVHFLPEDILPSKTPPIIKRTKKKNKIICMIPFHELVVFADGRISPCCNFIMHDESSEAVENIKKNSLKKIWFGEKFNEFRRRMIFGIPPKRCLECTPDFKSVEREYS